MLEEVFGFDNASRLIVFSSAGIAFFWRSVLKLLWKVNGCSPRFGTPGDTPGVLSWLELLVGDSSNVEQVGHFLW